MDPVKHRPPTCFEHMFECLWTTFHGQSGVFDLSEEELGDVPPEERAPRAASDNCASLARSDFCFPRRVHQGECGAACRRLERTHLPMGGHGPHDERVPR